MKDAYKPVWAVLIVAAAVLAVAGFSTWNRSTGGKERIPWRTDFDAARAEAAQTGKPVFAYFTADWCGPCQSLKSTTWADPNVEAALRNYVPVKVDVDRHADLARRYLLTPSNPEGGIPAFRVLDDKGDIRKEIVGAMPPGDFLQWLGSS